jgi:hypothetical protein
MFFREDIVIPIVVFGVTALIVKMSLDYRLRKQMLEKGVSAGEVKGSQFNLWAHTPLSSLKWGMILVAVGLGIVLGQRLDFGRDSDGMMVAFMLMFGGAALAIYYFIASRVVKKMKDEESQRP